MRSADTTPPTMDTTPFCPLNLVVMLGGPSAEREVSLRSGKAVAGALRSLGHRVLELDPRPNRWTLPRDTDVVFLALHGTYGEDGVVQEQLQTLGVPYTGCDPEASRVAFDKALTKERLIAAGVPTAPFLVLRSPQSALPHGWKPPVVLKPVRQGSSVGLHILESEDGFAAALQDALRYDREVLLEERIPGRETTVGILDDRALPVVEVRPHIGTYDYHSKYTSGATEYIVPAPFAPPVLARVQEAALAAFRAIGGRDYARVDIIVRPDGNPVVLEINTLPGMTELSLLPKAAQHAGLAFADLCQFMVGLALKRRTPRTAANTAAGP